MSAGTFIFICSSCGYKARLPDQYAGKTIKCPGCQAAQIATAPVNTERKTASIIKVAATPVPFTLPKEQMEALATATPTVLASAETAPAARSFATPLPGALQITTDKVTRLKTPVPGSLAPVAKAVATGSTVDFTCSACKARLRLPAHYVGKSILCPKCSAPQKVADTGAPPEPMGTTRSHQQREPSSANPVLSPLEPPRPVVQVQITPLPSPTPAAKPVVPTFPTPLPSPAPAHIESAITPVPGQAIVPEAVAAAPSDANLANLIDDIGASAAPQPLSKPHPSKSGRTNRIAATPAETPAAPAALAPVVAPAAAAPSPRSRTETVVSEPIRSEPPRRSPVLLIVLIGVFALACIGLGGLVVMNRTAMAEQQRQLEETKARAQEQEKAASAREKDMSDKLDKLTQLLETLQAELKAAKEATSSNGAENGAPAPLIDQADAALHSPVDPMVVPPTDTPAPAVEDVPPPTNTNEVTY